MGTWVSVKDDLKLEVFPGGAFIATYQKIPVKGDYNFIGWNTAHVELKGGIGQIISILKWAAGEAPLVVRVYPSWTLLTIKDHEGQTITLNRAWL